MAANVTQSEIRAASLLSRELLKTGRFGVSRPKDFSRLVEILSALHEAREFDPVELTVVAALCLLNPIGWDALAVEMQPPLHIVNQVLQILRDSTPRDEQATDRVRDICIAFGCGLCRTIDDVGDPWGRLWGPARSALVSYARNALIDAEEWLARVVPSRHPLDQDELREVADRLTWQMIRPTHPVRISPGNLRIEQTKDYAEITICEKEHVFVAPGKKYVFVSREAVKFKAQDPVSLDPEVKKVTVDGQVFEIAGGSTIVVSSLKTGKTQIREMNERAILHNLKEGGRIGNLNETKMDVWECTCGTPNCRYRHRLAAWDLTKRSNAGELISLRQFVKSAFIGPGAAPTSGVFSQGMYFSQIPGIIVVDVEYMVCPKCEEDKRSGLKGADPLCEFEYCKKHNEWFDRNRISKTARERLIRVDEWPTQYVPMKRYVCRGCRNVYDGRLSLNCPLCDELPSQNLSTVFVRRDVKLEAIQELKDQDRI